MRFASDDETIAAFLKVYDGIPEGDRERIPWEAIVIAAKIDANNFLGATLFAMQSTAVNQVKFIALSHYPGVMKATAKYAVMPAGERDRATFHQGLGFLPSPKGPTFIGKAIFGGASTTVADEENDGEKAPTFAMEENLDNIFPSATTMQNKLVPIRQRLLENSNETK